MQMDELGASQREAVNDEYCRGIDALMRQLGISEEAAWIIALEEGLDGLEARLGRNALVSEVE